MAVKKATTTSDLQSEAESKEDGKYVKVTSPMGAVTTVPAELVDVLVGSGYKKSK